MNVMTLKNIRKTYHMGKIDVHALKDISFEVEKGDFTIIIGPSGSGKSTLLQILGGLDRPTSGDVIIERENISNMKDQELAIVRNKKIGFVFQKFNLLSNMTALENVALPMVYAGVGLSERKEKAKELLDLVGLGNRVTHKPNELSGGQQQRVAIARALANDPTFLLADEPTGNLDTKSGIDILKVFHKLHSMGKTLVIVTHDQEMVDEGNKVVKIRDGLIEEVN
ncbi:ABC transporter ATP-binding protein [Geotoga petraea]|uniref:ABC transporter ATP-binding protein n=1 Tax=Geotoga petraea TaxID=28234 RepID=A0A4Z0VWJ3_9BACT|nr:ABC transporter ATP-binding protein [Geotoga petraea]MDK2945784.1 putative transport system ATP-binding protein [Geotoga sp.]TGG88431.1 ABC transporter ATP-binding protein [Geotoga petraea]